MAYRVNYVNSKGKKRTFTYISPQERVEKFKIELQNGFMLSSDYMPKVTKGYNILFLTEKQKQYRKDYISLYNKTADANVSKYAKQNFHRDMQNFIKFNK